MAEIKSILLADDDPNDVELALGVNAYVVKSVSFDHLVDVVSQTGLFWAVINEPPPGTVARPAREKPVGKD